MSETIIVCPHCKQEIPLTEVITHKIKEDLRKEFDADFQKKESEFRIKERNLSIREKEIENSREQIAQEIARRVKLEKENLEKNARQRAEEENFVKIKALQDELESNKKRLRESQRIELELRRQKTELEEREKNIDLEIARKVDAERITIQNDAIKMTREEQAFKDREKEKLIDDLTSQITELKRKAEQGSQQVQGEVMELELEEILRSVFPYDSIEPVAKGTKGADVLQKVNNPLGQYCGTIIWESKRTKNWNDGWIDKLKDDQREAKAEVAVFMTVVLPKEVNNFDYYKGVWVTNYASAMGLATALRLSLMEVAHVKQSVIGRQEKMEVLYNYLSGPEFKQKVEAIVEAFISMKQDLDNEKRVTAKLWAKREKQIIRVVNNTIKMYGDMEGIIGASLPQIKSLELKTLEDDNLREEPNAIES